MARDFADLQGSEKVKFESNFPFENGPEAWQLLITSAVCTLLGLKIRGDTNRRSGNAV